MIIALPQPALTRFTDGRADGTVHGIQPAVIHRDRLLDHLQIGEKCSPLRYVEMMLFSDYIATAP